MEKLLSLQITIFLLVAVGFGLKRGRIIGPQGQKNLTDLVIYVILPCNILKAFLSGTQSGTAESVFSSYMGIFLLSLFLQAFCVIYGKVVFRRQPEGKRKCLEYGIICSNAGFLGNPVAGGSIWGKRPCARQHLFNSAAGYDVVLWDRHIFRCKRF